MSSPNKGIFFPHDKEYMLLSKTLTDEDQNNITMLFKIKK